MHKLLAYQLRTARRGEAELDTEALLEVVNRTYEEFDRERRLNDRAVKLMEEELNAANEQIRRHGERKLVEALESAPCSIALVDAGGRIQCVNSTMRAILAQTGREPREGEHVLTVLSGRDSTAADEALLSDLFDGRPVEIGIAGHWFLGAARGLGDGSHAVALSDITALKEREAALDQAKQAAEAANRMKSEFLAVMSHELRTPLNAILGFSEVIKDRLLGEGPKAWGTYCRQAGLINESGQQLLSMISGILDLSTIESGSYALRPEPVDLVRLVSGCLEFIAPSACRGKVGLKPLDAPEALEIVADPRALRQVVLNLLSNAVKFTLAGGEVDVRIREEGARACIEVQDTGIGIGAKDLETVFEAFRQGDAYVSRQFGGQGFGLSIARGIVEMHGGSLSLESELGTGTCARIRLPQAQSRPNVQASAA